MPSLPQPSYTTSPKADVTAEEHALGPTPTWAEQVREQRVGDYPPHQTEFISPRLCPVKRPRKCITNTTNPFNSQSAVLSISKNKRFVEDQINKTSLGLRSSRC